MPPENDAYLAIIREMLAQQMASNEAIFKSIGAQNDMLALTRNEIGKITDTMEEIRQGQNKVDSLALNTAKEVFGDGQQLGLLSRVGKLEAIAGKYEDIPAIVESLQAAEQKNKEVRDCVNGDGTDESPGLRKTARTNSTRLTNLENAGKMTVREFLMKIGGFIIFALTVAGGTVGLIQAFPSQRAVESSRNIADVKQKLDKADLPEKAPPAPGVQ